MAKQSKTCTRCKQVKPLTDFFTDKRAEGGLRAQCKPCNGSYRKRPPPKPKKTNVTLDRVLSVIRARSSTAAEIAGASGVSLAVVRTAVTALRKRGEAHTLFGVWHFGPEPAGELERLRKIRAAEQKKRVSIRLRKARGTMTEDGQIVGRARGLYLCHGQMMTAEEASKATGLKKSTIYTRSQVGTPIDAPFRSKHRRKKPANDAPQLFDDSKRYEEDAQAQAVLGYLKRGVPLMTEDEIFALFNKPEEIALQRSVLDEAVGQGMGDPACSLEEARALRALLQHEMSLARGNSRCATLEEIGELMGVTRERARQIEVDALSRSRAAGARIGIERRVVDDLDLVDELRSRQRIAGLTTYRTSYAFGGIRKAS